MHFLFVFYLKEDDIRTLKNMSNKSIPSTYVKNILHNGVGRYVCQLQRVTLSFCKSHGGSRGMRDFIENHLLEFTRSNPGTVVYLKPRRHRPARIVGTYLNGESHSVPVDNLQSDEVCKWMEVMRTRSGVTIQRLRKMWHTDNPSIQGIWGPTLNKATSINICNFPNEELSKRPPTILSTSDMLQEMSKQVANLHISDIETNE